MTIFTDKKGTIARARLIGELDHHTATQVRSRLDALIVDGIRELDLDLSGLTFMDSSGIGVLIGRYKLMNERGGKVVVIKSNMHVDRIMRMAGLYGIISKA